MGLAVPSPCEVCPASDGSLTWRAATTGTWMTFPMLPFKQQSLHALCQNINQSSGSSNQEHQLRLQTTHSFSDCPYEGREGGERSWFSSFADLPGTAFN